MTARLRSEERSYESRKCLGPRWKHYEILRSCAEQNDDVKGVQSDGTSPEPAAPVVFQELHSESELIVEPFACNGDVQFWFSLTGNHNNSGITLTIIKKKASLTPI